MGRRFSGWLLVETEYVATRVAEAGGDFGGIGSEGLDNLASMGDYGFHGLGYAVDPDVDHEAGLGCGWASLDPSAAHLSDSVVEGCGSVAALPDIPTEYFAVE